MTGNTTLPGRELAKTAKPARRERRVDAFEWRTKVWLDASAAGPYTLLVSAASRSGGLHHDRGEPATGNETAVNIRLVDTGSLAG